MFANIVIVDSYQECTGTTTLNDSLPVSYILKHTLIM